MDFEDYYEDAKDDINDRLIEILDEEVEDKELHEMMHTAIKGGKRFRPSLALLTFDMLGGDDRSRAVTHGAIIELLHATSLLQDDVLEFDKTRRDSDSVWMHMAKKATKGLATLFPESFPGEYNPKVLSALMANNVLGGDGLLGLAYKLAAKNPDVAKAIGEGGLALSKGALKEADNMLRAKFFGTDEENYMRIIKGKTASLFATATQVGAISASSTSDREEDARKLGLNMGMCYQLVDDIAEDDVPNGVEAKELLVDQAERYDEVLQKFEQNKYRDMFEEALPFMVNKMLKQEDHPDRFERQYRGAFKWTSTD